MCLMSHIILGLEAEGAGGGRLAGISGLKKGFSVIVIILFSRFSWEDRMTQQEEWGVQQVCLFVDVLNCFYDFELKESAAIL